MLGSNPNRGGGIEQMMKRLEVVEDRTDRISPWRRMGQFYDDIK